jgi:nucleotide-binding universal stress UspA family protein
MTYKDVLLHLDSYPDMTPMEIVDEATEVCAALGGAVTATTFQTRLPVKSNFIADRLIGLSQLAEEEEARSLDNVCRLLARFAEQADKLGLERDTRPVEEVYYLQPERLAKVARTHDICVIPYVGEIATQTALAEAVVFSSGRPVLLFRGGAARPRAFRRILVAWDGGRAAIRAVTDALPLLRQAQEIRILTILGDKPEAVGGQATELLRHLAAHGVQAEAEEYTTAGESAGKILERVADERGFDLLVMGAYGHSRLREFFLGGATQHILTAPAIPVLLSH